MGTHSEQIGLCGVRGWLVHAVSGENGGGRGVSPALGCKSVPGTSCSQTQPSQCPGQCQEGSGSLCLLEGHMQSCTPHGGRVSIGPMGLQSMGFTPLLGDRVSPIPRHPPIAFIP